MECGGKLEVTFEAHGDFEGDFLPGGQLNLVVGSGG